MAKGKEIIVLHLDIDGLGTELKLRSFDMTSNTFLKEICLKCPEYMGLYWLIQFSLCKLH
jgi:vacuolar protein sorting-associated protein 13A/C